METTTSVLGIICCIICIILVILHRREIKKNKKLEKENEGLRHLSLHKEINLNTLIESSLPIESIANYLSYRIQFLIESRAQVGVVLDMMDELGITQGVKIPVGRQSNIDQIRIRIQEIIKDRFDRESLQTWVDSSRFNEKELTRLNSSFLKEIGSSMLVWSPQYA